MAQPGAALAMACRPFSTRGQKASFRLKTAISAAPSRAAWMAMAEAAPPPAQEDDPLPLHLHAAAAEVLGVAAAVGVVAHEGAVLIDDGVDGLDGLGGGGQFIEVGDDGVFAGHGDVGAPHPQGADGLDASPAFSWGMLKAR